MDKETKILTMFGGKELPALPEIFFEFNKAVKDPFLSIRQISQIVSKDQGLVSRVLRLANSALYSGFSEIRSIPQAISFLGIEMLRNIVLQIALVKTFRFRSEKMPDFDVRVFWEHSIATAYFADLLARKLNLPKDEGFYLGGLLHDIGKLLLFQYFPLRFEEIVLKEITADLPAIKAEEDILGINHAEIGGYLSRKWKFSKDLCRSIELHHSQSFSELNNLEKVIWLANILAKKASLALPWENREVDLFNQKIWQYFPFDSDFQVSELLLELAEETEKIREAVHLMLEISSN